MKIQRTFIALISCLLAAALVACAPTRTREGTGEYVDDSVITAKVKAALVADPALKAREINVETFRGTVQLSGFVSDPEEIPKAIKLTRDINGVKSVKNDMVVRK